MEEAPSTGDAPRAGQRRRRDGAGGHARGGSSRPREDEGEIEPVPETRGGVASPRREGCGGGGREGEWEMPERGGASAGRWLACGVVYLPASRPRRPLLEY